MVGRTTRLLTLLMAGTLLVSACSGSSGSAAPSGAAGSAGPAASGGTAADCQAGAASGTQIPEISSLILPVARAVPRM